jgi:chemosensory pili system protein ChpA (sensor histidine kinase/response regulator)
LESLAVFRQNPDDNTALQRTRANFRQAVGAIQMVGLDAIANFAVEIELQLDRLNDPACPVEQTLNAIETSSQKLRMFLTELSRGAPLLPMMLFPEYEAMQKLRGENVSFPADLFYPDLSIRLTDSGAKTGVSTDALSSLLITKRRVFQHGLLDWLRGNIVSGAERMLFAVSSIGESTPQPAIRTFWLTVAALLDIIRAGALQNTFPLQHLLARIDLQIRRLAEGSGNVAERLRRETLFFIAYNEPPATERVLNIQRIYQLPPLQQYLSQEGQAMLNTYVTVHEIKTHVNQVKAIWARLIAGQTDQFDKLREEIKLLYKQSAHSPYPETQQLFAALGKGSEELKPGSISETIGMEYATALLFAEDVFAQNGNSIADLAQQITAIRERIEAALHNRPLPAFDLPRLHEISQQAEDKILLPQLAQGIQANLRHMEQELDAFFRDHEKRDSLAALSKDAHEISGALRVLGRDDADDLLQMCIRQIESYSDPQTSVENSDLELLAESLSALGFYIEALEQQRAQSADLLTPLIQRYQKRNGSPDDDGTGGGRDKSVEDHQGEDSIADEITETEPMADNAPQNAADEAIDVAATQQPDAASESSELPDLNDGYESDWMDDQLSNLFTQTEDEPSSAYGDPFATTSAFEYAVDETVSHQEASPDEDMPVLDDEAPIEIEVPNIEGEYAEDFDDDAYDESPLSTFFDERPVEAMIEDSIKELAALGNELRANPSDDDLFLTITKKVQLLGDDAKLIADAELIDKVAVLKKALATEVRAAIPDRLKQLGEAPQQTISEETKRLLTIDASALDAELLDIFLEEARDVLDSVEENRALLVDTPNDIETIRAVRRAFHTLKGSGRMVGLTELGELAWDVEKIHNQLLEGNYPATPAVQHMMEVAEREFRSWINALVEQNEVTPDPTELHAAIAQVTQELEPKTSLSELLAKKSQPIAVVPAMATSPAFSTDTPALQPSDSAVPSTTTEAAIIPTIAELPASVTSKERATTAEGTQDGGFSFAVTPEDTTESAPTASDEGFHFALPMTASAKPEDPTASPRQAVVDEARGAVHLNVPLGSTPMAAATVAEHDAGDDRFEFTLPTYQHGEKATRTAAASAAPQDSDELSFDVIASPIPKKSSSFQIKIDDKNDTLSFAVSPQGTVAEAAPVAEATPAFTGDDGAGIQFDVPMGQVMAQPQDADEPTADDIVDPNLISINVVSAGARKLARPGISISIDDPSFKSPIVSTREWSAPAEPEPKPTAKSAIEPPKPQPGETVRIGDISLPKELYDMFTVEAGQHWQTLNRELVLMQVDPERVPSEDMIRAAHTLGSVHGTTGFTTVFNVGRALESLLIAARERAEAGAPPVSRVIPVTARAIEGLRALMDRILIKEPFVPAEEREAAAIVDDIEALKKGEMARVDPSLLRSSDTGMPIDAAMNQVTQGAVAKSSVFKPISAEVHTDTSVSLPAARTGITAGMTDAQVREVILQSKTHRLSASSAESGKESGAGIDMQLLPIFLDESGELIRSSEESFNALRSRPDDKGLALELKRNLHTLKGSARMVGAMRLGELAHQTETHLMENERLDDKVFELLATELERINYVVRQMRSGDLDPVYPWEDAPVEATEAATVSDDEPVKAEEKTEPEEKPRKRGLAAIEERLARKLNTRPDDTALKLARERAIADAKKSAERKKQAPVPIEESAMLRVAASKVDQLVNEAGEIIITRTRAEGELRELKSDLLELTGSVLRLRQHLRVIEIEAESRIQAQLEHMQDLHGNFDPLEFDRFTQLQEMTRSIAEGVNDVSTIQQTMLTHLDAINFALLSQSRMSRDVQATLFSIRTVPFASVSDRLFRIMRQVSKELNKQANLEIVGGHYELDRAILERLVVPLEHLLRNSLDHGVESPEERAAANKPERAEITVNVTHASGEIVVQFSDDGRGINRDKLREKIRARGEDPNQYTDAALVNLIFDAGMSTAQTVTAISGRGIGLDIVRNEILSLGGRLEVESEWGKGTTFILHLPLTVSVVQAMIIHGAGRTWAIPASLVEIVDHFNEEQIAQMYQTGKAELRGEEYPFFYFDWLVDSHEISTDTKRYNAVAFLRSGHETVAVHVEQVVGNQEIVIKSAGTQLLRRIHGMVGATILGTGDIVLILNPIHLAQRYALTDAAKQMREAAILMTQPKPDIPETLTEKSVLVVDDSLTVRKVTSRLLTREGFNVITAKDGFDALKTLEEQRPDIILLDIEMPKMDGFEFAKLVKGDDSLKTIPIIMITSRTADKHRLRAKELGVNAYLGKPYQEDELLANITDLLNNPTVTKI